MKLLFRFSVLAALAISGTAGNVRSAESTEIKSTKPKDIHEVDVTIDNGQVIVDIEADRCTTVIVGAKAGIEGPMTTHTADCANCDFRLGKVNWGMLAFD
jgi:hypothetical protein